MTDNIEKQPKNDEVVAEKKDRNKEKGSPTPAELLAELPEGMPPEMKRVVSMAMMQSSSPGGSRVHPLFEKFTEEHVHKYLDYIQRDDDFEQKLRGSNRWFQLGYTVIGMVFFGFLIVYLLPKDKALLNDILKLLFTFAGGVGSGYGLRSYLEKKR